MARLKLPKPVKHKSPPQRIYLYSSKVDMTEEGLNALKEYVASQSNSNEYDINITLENGEKLYDYKVISPENSHGANLISSRCTSGKHAPVIDIDVPMYVVPSSKLGHGHLYIDKEITWAQYTRILKALTSAGIVEEGYLEASMERGFTAVRPIGITKQGAPRGVDVLKENAKLRKKVYDKDIEIDHLLKELENGTPNAILEEVARLKSDLKITKQAVERYKDALNDASITLHNSRDLIVELRDTIKDMEVAAENKTVTDNPAIYKTIWT
jgi:hypothetical protein